MIPSQMNIMYYLVLRNCIYILFYIFHLSIFKINEAFNLGPVIYLWFPPALKTEPQLALTINHGDWCCPFSVTANLDT